jgi:uncharacterized phage protein (predicted DNA packaging)
MIVSVEEMKNYLRVDSSSEDALIENLIASSESLCMGIARTDDKAEFAEDAISRVAVMYAVAYLYEHREAADHMELARTLRSLLTGVRKEAF